MTVGELIEKLQKFDHNETVSLRAYFARGENGWRFAEINDVVAAHIGSPCGAYVDATESERTGYKLG